MTDPIDEFVAQVIRDHMITGPSPGQCRCGWGSAPEHLGRWHSRHVAEELRAVGVLRRVASD